MSSPQTNLLPELVLKKDIYYVEGLIQFNNVFPFFQKTLTELQTKSQWKIDFSHLAASNSAVLALIVEWVKVAKTKKIKIILLNLPDKLKMIAALSGIDKIVKIDA